MGDDFFPKYTPIGIKIFPYPNSNREITHGLTGNGSQLTPLDLASRCVAMDVEGTYMRIAKSDICYGRVRGEC
jgi:hypothetical protein